MILDSLARNRASLEYLTVQATANVELDQQPVVLAWTQRTQPTDDDWHDATWIGDPATTRQARYLLNDADLGVGTWWIWARVTDNPEIPVLLVGSLVIT